jgi:hypothetical protein
MKNQKLTFLAIAFLVIFAAACSPAAHPADSQKTAAMAASPTPLTIPNEISVPGQEPSYRAYAKGVQLYECKLNDQGQLAWLLNEPAAELFDDKGNSIGWHSAGPTWEAKDQSKVVGDTAKDKVTGKDQIARVTVDAKAIPWLRLPAKPGDGNGVFGNVQTIQRLSTTDGLAPAGGCDQAHQGNKRPVYYTATYYFYNAKP